MNIFKMLIQFSIDNNGIKIDQFLEICNANGMKLTQLEINDKLIYSYENKVKQFLTPLL